MNISPKQTLRQTLRQRRKALDAAARQAAEAAIGGHLRGMDWGGRTVAGYLALGSECDITPLLREGIWPVLLPRIDQPGGVMEWRFWDGRTQSLAPDALGMQAPIGETGRPEVVLAPLVGFDARGYRLGQGGGYYDRSLSALRAEYPAISTIGVGFECQRVEQLPTDPWDEPLDGVVTEKGLVMFPPRAYQ